MELRQLEHFLAVVEEGSFTAAAARVFLAQSSLSASVLALERELGTTLFVRGRRGAALTDAGLALLEPARAAEDAVRGARDAVAAVKGLVHGIVRIATMPGCVPLNIDICEAICRFRAEHPGVEVQLLPADAQSMIDMVADGRVDFALGPWTDDLTPQLEFRSLTRTPLVLICAAGHQLAGARDVHPRELLDEEIIDLPHTWRSRALFDRVLADHGVQREGAGLAVHDWNGALAMVQRDIGITYGPRASIDERIFGDLGIATLAGAPIWEVGIVTRDHGLRGAAGRAFLSMYLAMCSVPSRPGNP